MHFCLFYILEMSKKETNPRHYVKFDFYDNFTTLNTEFYIAFIVN